MLKQWLSHLRLERGALLVCLYAAVQFLYTYGIHSHNPIWRQGIDAGWYGWSDQANYLQIATDFAHGQLPRPLLYGPGYPILAAPNEIEIFPKHKAN